MVQCNKSRIRILDAGAGVGSLFVAVVEHLTSQQRLPKQMARLQNLWVKSA